MGLVLSGLRWLRNGLLLMLLVLGASSPWW